MSSRAALRRARDIVAIAFCCAVLGVLALGLAASAAVDIARHAGVQR